MIQQAEVVDYTSNSNSSSYILKHAVKDSNPDVPKPFVSAHEYFGIDSHEIQVQALDVEQKYTSKLAKDINNILKAYRVKPQHLSSSYDETYLRMLKLRYGILCQITVKQSRYELLT